MTRVKENIASKHIWITKHSKQATRKRICKKLFRIVELKLKLLQPSQDVYRSPRFKKTLFICARLPNVFVFDFKFTTENVKHFRLEILKKQFFFWVI